MAENNESCVQKVVVGVAIVVIGGLILTIVPAIRIFIGNSISWLWKFLSSSIRLPWGVFILMMIPIVVQTVNIIRKTTSTEPSIRDYKEDSIDGVTWKWDYVIKDGSPGGDLLPYCKTCGTKLIYRREFNPYNNPADRKEYIVFHCEFCSADKAQILGDIHSAKGSIEREIQRRVNVGEWRKSVLAQKAKNKSE